MRRSPSSSGPDASPAKRSVDFEALRDSQTEEAARATMRGNRKADTSPELALRRALWSHALRGYRKNVAGIKGRPDVVFPGHRLIVDLRGCFWHDCPACRAGKAVTKNATYWQAKIARNVERDAQNEVAWAELGYRVLVVWEHEVKQSPEDVVERVRCAIESSPYRAARARSRSVSSSEVTA